MFNKTLFKQVILTFTLLQLYGLVHTAVVHSHSSNLNKEREEDGAYSPRSRGHHFSSDSHDTEFDHESILGSVKEAEEYDKLPPEEAKRRLKILLTKMDLNGNYHIDQNELKAWIVRSYKMLSKEEAEENLESADENGDGKVTWEEYVKDTYGSDESNESFSTDSDNQQMLQDDKAMWKAADFNGDNILEGDEWVAFLHPDEHPKMTSIILEQTLRDKDIDKDGSISFQEYIGDRGKHNDKEWLLSERDKFLSELDKDKNEYLSGNEILSWVIPSIDEIVEEETSHLFSVCDDNADGILSFDEALNHHDIFVGSEVTDYGEHLHNIHQFQDEL